LKTSLAASATAALASQAAAASPSSSTAGPGVLRTACYRLKPAARAPCSTCYLEKALLPALDQRGVKDVGVFTELDVNKPAASSTPKADTPVWVLIPYGSFDAFVSVAATLNTDAAVQKAGAEYLEVRKANPAFDRIDTWLYLAFKGMPKHAVPAFSKSRTPTRVFEMRDYESHSELKAPEQDGDVRRRRNRAHEGSRHVARVFRAGHRGSEPAAPALHHLRGGPRHAPRQLEEIRP